MLNEVTNARRMAQTAWMALALYTFFGFHHIGGPEIQVLDKKINLGKEVEVGIGGLKLPIPKKYLDWGFPIFSLYASGFFYYIAFKKNRSPGATRRYFLNFQDQQMPVELMKNNGVVEVGIFRSYIASFFPKLDPYSFIFTKSKMSGTFGDQDKRLSSDKFNIEWPDGVGKETKLLCFIENLHYSFPLFFNVGFLFLYTVYCFVL